MSYRRTDPGHFAGEPSIEAARTEVLVWKQKEILPGKCPSCDAFLLQRDLIH